MVGVFYASIVLGSLSRSFWDNGGDNQEMELQKTSSS
jgi:hypothetical protein